MEREVDFALVARLAALLVERVDVAFVLAGALARLGAFARAAGRALEAFATFAGALARLGALARAAAFGLDAAAFAVLRFALLLVALALVLRAAIAFAGAFTFAGAFAFAAAPRLAGALAALALTAAGFRAAFAFAGALAEVRLEADALALAPAVDAAFAVVLVAMEFFPPFQTAVAGQRKFGRLETDDCKFIIGRKKPLSV